MHSRAGGSSVQVRAPDCLLLSLLAAPVESPPASSQLEAPLASPALKLASAPMVNAPDAWPLPQLHELAASLETAATLSRRPFDEKSKTNSQ